MFSVKTLQDSFLLDFSYFSTNQKNLEVKLVVLLFALQPDNKVSQ